MAFETGCWYRSAETINKRFETYIKQHVAKFDKAWHRFNNASSNTLMDISFYSQGTWRR